MRLQLIRRIGWLCPYLAAGAFLSCAIADRSSLVGKYEADHGAAVEQLVLRADGTFEQQVTLRRTRSELTATGTWSFSDGEIAFSNDFLVTLDGFGRPVNDPGGHHDGTVALPAINWFGRPSIEIYEGIYYSKTD